MEVLLDEEKQEVALEGQIEKIGELEKSDVSTTESKSNVIMTVGDGSAQPGHNMTAMTVGLISAPSAGQHKPSPRVKVKIEYPKSFKGSKHFRDGEIKEVAPETADQFVQLGIASIVDPDKAD